MRPYSGRFTSIISIHALREEGDILKHLANKALDKISIHALREEGDGVCFFLG